MEQESQISRRNFLGTATFAIGGIISAGLAVPAVVYVIGPALKRVETQTWLPLGSTNKVEIGIPTLFKIKIERQTGWISDEEELSVYITTQNGRDYVALSNICTHLGCRVRWISEKSEFFCPCHNAVFDENGDVVAGPPPRALDRYETRIEDDIIHIQVG